MQDENSTEDISDQENEDEDEEQEDEDGDDEELDESKRSRNKSLLEFRFRVEEAIIGNYLFVKMPKRNFSKQNNIKNETLRLWGVPLSPSVGHPGTDIVLMKFLKAKRFKVHEAFVLLRKTLKWRVDESCSNEDVVLRAELDKLWFESGRDKEGRPLCYSLWGKEAMRQILSLSGDQKHGHGQQYLRWKVVCVEKGVESLSFRPGEANSIVQVIDLENSMKSAKKEVKFICKKMMSLLHNYYPGIVYKNLIINVPTWFMALNALNLRLITQKSRNKFIFVKPSKVTETLLKYATAENILVQYGGLRRENDTEFSIDDKVLEVNIRANSTEHIQIPIIEAGVTVTWDITVVGFEVAYKEEFIPDDDCSYKILLQEKKMVESIRNSFHIREPGKIVLSIVNASFTKKKAFYRYKSRPTVPMYMFIKQQTFSDPKPCF